MNRQTYKKNERGFTLIELLVAMGIFISLTGIVSTAFIKSMRTQKSSVALMAANDGAALSLEQMAREMRTGTSFVETKDNEELTFVNSKNKTVSYILADNAIEREETDPVTLEKKKSRITPDTVKVMKFGINISGNVPGDKIVSRITVSIGVSFPGKDELYNTIQMTISPRTLINES